MNILVLSSFEVPCEQILAIRLDLHVIYVMVFQTDDSKPMTNVSRNPLIFSAIFFSLSWFLVQPPFVLMRTERQFGKPWQETVSGEV